MDWLVSYRIGTPLRVVGSPTCASSELGLTFEYGDGVLTGLTASAFRSR